MTHKGAQIVIEALSLRVFEIQEHRERLAKEEQDLVARIKELEGRMQGSIQPQRIISVG